MDQSKLKHTWRFPRTSRLIRFYCWLWCADARRLTFCALFWGLLFAPLALPFRLLGATVGRYAVVPLSRAIARWYAAHSPKRPPRASAPTLKAEHLRVKQTVPDRVSGWCARPGLRRAARIVGYAAIAVAAAALIYGAVLLAPTVWGAIKEAAGGVWIALKFLVDEPLTVLKYIGVGLAGGTGGLLAIGLLTLLATDSSRRFFRRAWIRFETVVLFVVEALKGIKYNTCPRIELDDGTGVRAPGDSDDLLGSHA